MLSKREIKKLKTIVINKEKTDNMINNILVNFEINLEILEFIFNNCKFGPCCEQAQEIYDIIDTTLSNYYGRD